jgi:hypothetical protein
MQGAVRELAQRGRGEPLVAGELVTVRDGDEPPSETRLAVHA